MLGRVVAYARRHHIALLALFVALGGTGAYAAERISGEQIENRSIAGKKLKPNTLTGRQIKEQTLRCRLIRGCGAGGEVVGEQGPAGPSGPAGAAGATGPAGPQGDLGPPGAAALADPIQAGRDGLALTSDTTVTDWTVSPDVELLIGRLPD